MAAVRNTCLSWRCIDEMQEMTRGHYNDTETKMSLIHNSWCETNDSWQFLDEPWKDKWWILESPADWFDLFQMDTRGKQCRCVSRTKCITGDQAGEMEVSNDLQKRFVIFVVKIRTVQSIIIRIIFIISNIYKNWNQLIQRQSVSWNSHWKIWLKTYLWVWEYYFRE